MVNSLVLSSSLASQRPTWMEMGGWNSRGHASSYTVKVLSAHQSVFCQNLQPVHRFCINVKPDSSDLNEKPMDSLSHELLTFLV